MRCWDKKSPWWRSHVTSRKRRFNSSRENHKFYNEFLESIYTLCRLFVPTGEITIGIFEAQLNFSFHKFCFSAINNNWRSFLTQHKILFLPAVSGFRKKFLALITPTRNEKVNRSSSKDPAKLCQNCRQKQFTLAYLVRFQHYMGPSMDV